MRDNTVMLRTNQSDKERVYLVKAMAYQLLKESQIKNRKWGL
jgi:hypothetical protein